MITDLLAGWHAIEDAEDAYCVAEDHYSGAASEQFASEQVERAIGESGRAYRMPLIRNAVNVLANRCQIRRVSAPGNASLTTWIEDVSKANDLKVYDSELVKQTLKYGDYYRMVYPLWSTGETAEAPASEADEALEEVGIEITHHSPKRVRVFYDEENERRKAYALKRWPVKDESKPDWELWRVDLYYPTHIEHWVSVYGQPPEKEEGWREAAPDDRNEYGEIPFFHFRTGLLYGESVMTPGYGAQNAITKMTVTQVTTAESQAFGQRYALLNIEASLDANNDAPDFPQDDDDLATAGDGPLRPYGAQRTALRGGPGTMIELEGVDSVGQFPQADPKVFMDPAEDYLDYLAILTETPLHSYKPRVQPESGEAKRIAEAPLVKRAGDMQNILASPLEESWRFALKLAGKDTEAPLRVSWSPAYAADGVDDWQMIQLQILCGVPQDVALTDAGYEKDQVTQWLDDAPEQMSLATRIGLLKTLGEAVEGFGLGGVLGVQGASAAPPSGPVYSAVRELTATLTETTERPG